jgi:hypothetical protein
MRLTDGIFVTQRVKASVRSFIVLLATERQVDPRGQVAGDVV